MGWLKRLFCGDAPVTQKQIDKIHHLKCDIVHMHKAKKKLYDLVWKHAYQEVVICVKGNRKTHCPHCEQETYYGVFAPVLKTERDSGLSRDVIEKIHDQYALSIKCKERELIALGLCKKDVENLVKKAYPNNR